MTVTVDVHEAKTCLFELARGHATGRGDRDRRGGPVARPSRSETCPRERRQLGTGKGPIVIHDSFEAALPEAFLDLFEGKE